MKDKLSLKKGKAIFKDERNKRIFIIILSLKKIKSILNINKR